MKTNRKTTQTASASKAKKTKARAVPKPASMQIENLLERVSDGIVAFDAGMNYTYVNQRGGELLGREPADLIGKNYWEEYPEAKDTPFAKAYVRALKTQTPIVIEDYYAPFDRWFENRIFPSRDGLTIFFTEITELKKAELELREAQERLTLAMRSANIGLWDWDLQTNKVHYSPEWKSQLGCEDREVSDDFSEWENRVHPEDLERAKATVSGYIENPYPDFHNEFRMRHKDGSYHWILAQASLMTNERGKPIRMIGSHIDITGRKQTEDQVGERERQLSTLISNLPGAVFRVRNDPSYTVEYVSDRIAELTGYPADDFRENRRNFGELMHPDDREWVWNETQKALGEHRPYNLTYRIIDAKGQEKWNWDSGEGIFDANGELQAIEGFVQDITERKQAEEKIAYQANLLANVNDAILASDEAFVLTAWNRAAERIYGWKAEEVIGRSGTEILQTEFLTISRPEAIKQLIETGDFIAEVSQLRKDGTRIYVETRTTALRDQNGKTTGYVTVNRDISERKRAEDELRSSEERFSSAFYTSPAGITITRIADGKFVDANEAFCSMFEFTREEVIGHTSTELNMWTPDERKKLIDEQIRSGGLHDFELQARTKSGRVVSILFSSKPMEIGGETHHITTLIDITGRKQAEEALRVSEERLRLSTELADVAVWEYSFAANSMSRSKNHDKLYGLPWQEKWEFDTFLNATHPDDRAYSNDIIQKSAAPGGPDQYAFDFRVVYPDKTVHWLNVIGQVVERDADGRGTTVRGTLIDITERKRAEEELRLRAEQLAAFNAVGRRVASSLSEGEVAQAALEEMIRSVAPDLAMLFLREGKNLSLLGSLSTGDGLHHDETPIHRVGECLCGLAVIERRAVYSTDIRTDLRCTWMECKQAGVVSFAALPLRTENEVIGVIGLASKDERDFSAIAAFLETLADQIALGLQNARLYKDLQGRLVALTAIYEVSQRLQKLLDPEELSFEIIELLEKNLGYEHGAVLLVEESNGKLIPFAVAGRENSANFVERDKAYIASHELYLGKGITGWVAQHGESVRLGDVSKDERYYGLRAVDICSELCVPLLAGEKTIGVINVETTKPDAYNEQDQRVLETVAAQISVAIQNARLLEETRLSRDRLAELSKKLVEAHEAESRAIGRELHDQVGQMLTALKLTLEIARQMPPEQAAPKLAGAQELLDDLMTRISRLSLDLRPPMLDDLGLIPALLWHVNRFQEQAHIAVDFRHSGVEGKRFSPEIETTAYRIVQEAFTNVARHARAGRVRLEVQVASSPKGGSQRMEIQIEDNGVGFDPQAALALNRGLGSMRERVQLVGGAVHIESQPGKGAKKFIQLPLREKAA